MKVIVSALVVGFALLVGLVPSSDATECYEYDGCETKLGLHSPRGLLKVDCDLCAFWGCFYDNVFYYGSGCVGDENICNTGDNQIESGYKDEKGFFFTCYGCDVDISEKMKKLRDRKQLPFLIDKPCNVYNKRRKNDTSIICEKQNTCETKSFKRDDIVAGGIECDECAGWNCVINKTLYTGYGCKGDINICKAGNNQNESKKYENSSWFVTCNKDRCASHTLSKLKENATFSNDDYNDDGECHTQGLKHVLESTSTQLPCKQLPNNNQFPHSTQLPHPKQLSGKTTTANPNEAKTGSVLKLAGMVLIGCLFIGF